MNGVYLKAMMSWAIEAELIEVNAARDLRPYSQAGREGYHAWAPNDVSAFLQARPKGSKARLALVMMLLTGLRRSDAVRLGFDQVYGGQRRQDADATRLASAGR